MSLNSRFSPLWVFCGAFLVPAMVLGAVSVSAQVRSIDGVGTNSVHPNFGAVNTPLLRIGPTTYADGFSSPTDGGRPNPRRVSTIVFDQGEQSIPEPSGASGFVFQWGQFLDHDMDLTEAAAPPEPLDISIPVNDPLFPPTAVIFFLRSAFEPETGTELGNPRQQRNQITAYIDASNVYGSDPLRAAALRTNDGSGRLKTSAHNLLPFNVRGWPNAGGPDPELYLAGDVRANEQVGLTAMHVLFMREHNRQAEEIAAAHPELDDEEIYQTARARVGALMQVITYREFLPVILGPGVLPPLPEVFDPEVDPSISNEFATAAYRFGHSMIAPVLRRLKANGQSIPDGPLSLRDAFFTRHELDPSQGKGIEPLLRGLALTPSQAVDAMVVDDVRNFLFGDPAAGGLDLVALNIQRGRDHGLPSYNQLRAGGPASGFDEVSSRFQVPERLAEAYGSVDLIDLWVGGLAEDSLPGALVGPTFHAILVDQFRRLRDGDPFWYERKFSGSELAALENTTLADIIVRNTKIKAEEIGANVFLVP